MAIYMWREAAPITIAWIYHSPEQWLISLSSDWTNWITIADKNEWATTVWNGTDSISSSSTFLWYPQEFNNIVAPTGYHIPSDVEFNNIIQIWINMGAWSSWQWYIMTQLLRMPWLWYYRSGSWYQSQYRRFWTNVSESTNYGYRLNAWSSVLEVATENKNDRLLIRVIKDTPVQPDETRIVLYPTS